MKRCLCIAIMSASFYHVSHAMNEAQKSVGYNEQALVMSVGLIHQGVQPTTCPIASSKQEKSDRILFPHRSEAVKAAGILALITNLSLLYQQALSQSRGAVSGSKAKNAESNGNIDKSSNKRDGSRNIHDLVSTAYYAAFIGSMVPTKSSVVPSITAKQQEPTVSSADPDRLAIVIYQPSVIEKVFAEMRKKENEKKSLNTVGSDQKESWELGAEWILVDPDNDEWIEVTE